MKTFIYSLILLSILSSITSHIFIGNEEEILSQLDQKINNPEFTKSLFEWYNCNYEKTKHHQLSDSSRKYETFLKNLHYINSQNQQDNSYKLGLTPLTDMSEEEIQQFYLNNKIDSDLENFGTQSAPKENKKSLNFLENESDTFENIYAPIDWRSKLTPVRNQLKCGSCWTFSAAGSSENNYNIKHNTTLVFSTQQLVDCDKFSEGCNGGNSSQALEYARRVGFVEDSAYPYLAKDGQCNQDIIDDVNIAKYKVKEVLGCEGCKIDQWYNLLSQGPITISIFVNDDFKHYKSGIYSFKDCNSDSSNHAILAVGWGVDIDFNTGEVTQYTIIRNSWSNTWGEEGYGRVKYQPEMNDSCFVNKRGYLPKF